MIRAIIRRMRNRRPGPPPAAVAARSIVCSAAAARACDRRRNVAGDARRGDACGEAGTERQRDPAAPPARHPTCPPAHRAPRHHRTIAAARRMAPASRPPTPGTSPPTAPARAPRKPRPDASPRAAPMPADTNLPHGPASPATRCIIGSARRSSGAAARKPRAARRPTLRRPRPTDGGRGRCAGRTLPHRRRPLPAERRD